MRYFLIFWLSLLLAGSLPASARIRYVKLNATGLNNGTSWANAFNSFDSIRTYVRDTLIMDTFWVANGVYKPTFNRRIQITTIGLKIYGGFNGTETQLSQRNWSTFQTVLDGDLGVPGVVTDNVGVVLDIHHDGITAGGAIPPWQFRNMRIDGFKITNSYGGAGVKYPCSNKDTIEIANCLFTNHVSSTRGAFYYTNDANLGVPDSAICRLTNCRFEHNSSAGYGGAINVSSSSSLPSYPTARFRSNLIITDCKFSNDSAAYGGAIANLDSLIAISINRCIFKGNTATIAGGAIYDTACSKTSIYNSLIVGNSAPKSGAWYRNVGAPGGAVLPRHIVQCTFADNKSTSTLSNDYSLTLTNKDSIQNNIFWGNVSGSGQVLSPVSGATYVASNIIEGGMPGTFSTINLNPQFTSPGGASAAPFPASSSYDYHLAVTSPAIDLGMPLTAPAGMNTLDLDKANRIYGPASDFGAYELSYCVLPRVGIVPGAAFICLSSQDSVLLTANGGAGAGTYTWIGQGTKGGGAIKANSIWAKDSGTYYVMSYDSATGCRGQGSVYVRVVPKMTPVISITGSVLSVPAVYSAYQWYKDGAVIVGATSNTYTATANGYYTIRVQIRAAECTDSASYNLTNLGLGAAGVGEGIVHIVPNPSGGRFRISVGPGVAVRQISITDITGRRVQELHYDGHTQPFMTSLDLGAQPRGLYFVRVNTDSGLLTSKVLIE